MPFHFRSMCGSFFQSCSDLFGVAISGTSQNRWSAGHEWPGEMSSSRRSRGHEGPRQVRSRPVAHIHDSFAGSHIGLRPRPGPAPPGHQAASDRPAGGDRGGLHGRRPPRRGPGPPRVRARRSGGVDGRRAGRLVRRHRPVPPPARPPDPAHRDHPGAQGPVRRDARRVRPGELPDARRDRRAGARRPASAPGWPTGWPTPDNADRAGRPRRSTPPCGWPTSSRTRTSQRLVDGGVLQPGRRPVDRSRRWPAGRSTS